MQLQVLSEKRLFLFGFSYVAMHFLALNQGMFAHIASTARSHEKAAWLRASGVDAHVWAGGAIDEAMRAALLDATHVIVSMPPMDGALLRPVLDVLAESAAHPRVLYLSTTAVYGDVGGAWVDEETPLHASSPRGVARIEAEVLWLDAATAAGGDGCALRLSGIYGPGRNALEQIKAGEARRILKEGQVFNRVHVHDIARALGALVLAEHVPAALNVSDDEPSSSADVMEYAAQLMGAPVPPPVRFEDAQLPPMAASFYAENKRVDNTRLRALLGGALTYPTYREGLSALWDEIQSSRLN
jgi:nucleoside-diphosphate-sugar epimerase